MKHATVWVRTRDSLDQASSGSLECISSESTASPRRSLRRVRDALTRVRDALGPESEMHSTRVRDALNTSPETHSDQPESETHSTRVRDALRPTRVLFFSPILSILSTYNDTHLYNRVSNSRVNIFLSSHHIANWLHRTTQFVLPHQHYNLNLFVSGIHYWLN